MTTLFRTTAIPAVDLFDVHINVLPPGIAKPASFYQTLPVSDLSATGVAGGCVSPCALPDYAQANDALLAWSKNDESFFLPFARLNGSGGPRTIRRRSRAKHKPEPLSDVARLQQFAGVKLMPHVDGIPAAKYIDAIAELRRPVLIHSGAWCPPAWIAKHLLPHLRGPLILAHLGSWPCAAECLQDAVKLAAEHEQVYLETSGASIGNFIAYAADRVPHKLLFGSNSPMSPPAIQWGHVAAAVCDDDTLRAIGHENAARIFAATSRAS